MTSSEKLMREITDITIDAEADPDMVFAALSGVITFWMSYLCADCRREMAHRLDMSAMLKAADQAAAKFNNPPLCH
jgi:hypothetical protein